MLSSRAAVATVSGVPLPFRRVGAVAPTATADLARRVGDLLAADLVTADRSSGLPYAVRRSFHMNPTAVAAGRAAAATVRDLRGDVGRLVARCGLTVHTLAVAELRARTGAPGALAALFRAERRIYVAGELAPDERRLAIAHEGGHWLVPSFVDAPAYDHAAPDIWNHPLEAAAEAFARTFTSDDRDEQEGEMATKKAGALEGAAAAVARRVQDLAEVRSVAVADLEALKRRRAELRALPEASADASAWWSGIDQRADELSMLDARIREREAALAALEGPHRQRLAEARRELDAAARLAYIDGASHAMTIAHDHLVAALDAIYGLEDGRLALIAETGAQVEDQRLAALELLIAQACVIAETDVFGSGALDVRLWLDRFAATRGRRA